VPSFGWRDVLHPDDAERTIAAWKKCVQTGGVWDIEHRCRGVDGRWHPILARGVAVHNERGEVIYWVGINLDISRMKEAKRVCAEQRGTEPLQPHGRGRELRMIELKKEINALCEKAGLPAQHTLDFEPESRNRSTLTRRKHNRAIQEEEEDNTDPGEVPHRHPGLDEITLAVCRGGGPRSSAGGAGCGKTLLAMGFIVRGIRDYGERESFIIGV